MPQARDIMTLVLSDGKSHSFDVTVDDRNPCDKLLLMISVTEEDGNVWTTSLYEDDISTTSNFVAETLVFPSSVQTSDVVSVASLLYLIVSDAKRRKCETSS